MKRALQGLALVQLALLVAIAVRIVGVWTTPLPEFPDIPELPAESQLPPARPAPRIPATVTNAIVDHDLFDEQRGQAEEIDVAVDPALLVPVAPPTTVKLMGVLQIGAEPMAILLDTNVKPEQVSVRKGEMFGEYEVGDIGPRGVTLLGTAGQQFHVPLRIEAAAAAAAPGKPGSPAAGVRPGTNPQQPAQPGKPAQARPIQPQTDNAAADQKAMSARERAQAIAQRNADLRKNSPKAGPDGNEGAAGADADPVQARLEALRALREAAKTH